jgi:hypothetical protein
MVELVANAVLNGIAFGSTLDEQGIAGALRGSPV